MATYRIGIGSFNLKDGAVGIGTESTGLGNLKVEGTYKTTDLDVTGVSTFTRYAGFAADNISINVDRTLTGEHQTTGDIVVGVNSTFTVSTGATVCTGTVESISLTDHFSPPCGYVNDRPEVPVEGTVRFNKDLNTLEFYNGVDWRQFTVNGSSGRVVIAGGQMASRSPVSTSPTMHHFNINTFGNSTYFGELVVERRQTSCCGNTVRGQVWGGQGNPSNVDNIDYFTMASEGNAVDFGNMLGASQTTQALSSSTRGISYGHGEPESNVIQYTELATIGNAIDFGDAALETRSGATWASPTRGMLAGGASKRKHIEFITIASKGNGTKFGELTESRRGLSGCSNSVRGLAMGGYDGSGSPYRRYKTIDYVTIASEGNAIHFGDLTNAVSSNACAASPIRGINAGGSLNPNSVNTIDYILIASTGNAMDFGDLSESYWDQTAAITDCHGGLGGY